MLIQWRKIRLLLMAIATVLMVVSCRGTDQLPQSASPDTTPNTDCRVVQHEGGETEVCGQPEKIVVLGPYVLEPLVALDAQPIAFADHLAFHQGDYDDPNLQIPYLGRRISQPLANVGTAFSPSIEAIIKVKPDLILGTKFNTEQYENLAKIAPTVLVDYQDSEQSLKTIARAIDRTEKAKQLLEETEEKIAAARQTFAPLVKAHPRLLLLVSGKFPEIYLGNNAGLCDSLVEKLGFELVSLPKLKSVDPDAARVLISLETLPQLNEADSVILLGNNSEKLDTLNGVNDFEKHQLSNLKQAWKKNAIAQSLDASKAGRVYFLPAYLCLGLPGPIGTELYLEELEKQLLPPQ